MRLIGQVTGESEAAKLSDFLVVQGIANEVEANADGTWAVWVLDEEQLETARTHIAAFLANPSDARYKKASAQARREREKVQEEEEQLEKRVHKSEAIWDSSAASSQGPFTFFLLFVCAACFFISDGGSQEHVLEHLLISKTFAGFLTEVRHGEVWRLITPIFLHLGWMHLLGNSLVLLFVGRPMELILGTRFYIAFVLITAVLSNLAQYWFSGPAFMGISGVGFGVTAYVWQRARLDPFSGFMMHPTTAMLMFVYFILGWVGSFADPGSLKLIGVPGRMANMVHTVGLVIGILWATWHSRRR